LSTPKGALLPCHFLWGYYVHAINGNVLLSKHSIEQYLKTTKHFHKQKKSTIKNNHIKRLTDYIYKFLNNL